MNLNDARVKETYIVENIDSSDVESMKKLLSMGILPGTELKVLQKNPTIIFEVYHSRFAIDNKLGEKIYVKKNNA
ncbi:ferrous iron transport protein A [Deferribacteraceae bacterium V6Fe1]|uniref:FeoA family protein n=1 Tax=Deferrivibrio essentukiensis TaxID=2880922 RepID=UPI001F60CB88|nr:FeoA family protein [Deferrivibrio essentukiensis]MCB4204801.1 ferrous iron transport protein A [Deferrivibrio essentukiensis]UOD35557.1 ferrous iron transport protein A [Deferribacteraceae bacterium V6Fe1]